MVARQLVLATLLALASSFAFAAHCPMDMQQIDAALATKPLLSAEQLAEVKKLRAEGEALHKAGKHDESVVALGKAKNLLGI